MGRLLPGNRVRVVDPDSGRTLGVGEEGELAIAGPTLMEGYLGVAPEECFDADGFFRTGDTGHVDAEGYLHFAGRRTEMIKTGGANVSPAELEVQLRACPPVKLSRIVGVPDPRLDQLVVACITLKDGATASAERHPRLPAGAGRPLQGAQAGPVLRRRRDPDDPRRHQGPRPRAPRPRPGAPRRPTRPDRRPMTTTDTEPAEDTDALDVSDLDRHMGVPIEPGELKEPVTTNDIRRWVQAMHYPNPLHYDERWAGESRFGAIVAPQSFTVACDTSHGASPAQVGLIPSSHLIFGGDDWWFFGPQVLPGDKLLCHRMPYDYRVTETRFAGPTCFQRGDTLYINQRGERVALQRSTAIRYRARAGPREGALLRAERARVDRRRAGRPRGAQAGLHRADPGAGPRPAALRLGGGGRPAGRERPRARTAWPASPPSGAPSP